MTTASILTIGDELLIGQVIDTNSAWIATQLNDEGFRVVHKQTVGDDEEDILRALGEAQARTDIVLVTGGLGPTKDDITLRALCQHFHTTLHFSDTVYAHIARMFARRGIQMNELTRQQALVPDAATVIMNQAGTAPCTWFQCPGRVLVSMPGVPSEMKWLMTNEIIPRLRRHFGHGAGIAHRTCWVSGYAESALAIHLSDFERDLPPEVRLAYLPQLGIIRLRLSAYCPQQADADRIADTLRIRLREILGSHILAEGDRPFEAIIGEQLRTAGLTVGTAESCTGGAIAATLTSVPGSSDYFMGGIVSYTNAVKRHLLRVSPTDLQQCGPVSQPVVEQMARGAREALHCDIAVATSGIAGPGGSTPETPIGTVWIAIATPTRTLSKLHHFAATRDQNITRAVNTALLMLLDAIKSEHQ